MIGAFKAIVAVVIAVLFKLILQLHARLPQDLQPLTFRLTVQRCRGMRPLVQCLISLNISYQVHQAGQLLPQQAIPPC